MPNAPSAIPTLASLFSTADLVVRPDVLRVQLADALPGRSMFRESSRQPIAGDSFEGSRSCGDRSATVRCRHGAASRCVAMVGRPESEQITVQHLPDALPGDGPGQLSPIACAELRRDLPHVTQNEAVGRAALVRLYPRPAGR